MLIVAADRDHVVITGRTIFDQQDQRMARLDLLSNRRQRSFEALRVPSARPNRIDERGISDAAGVRVDQRFELLNVRMPIAPEAKHHGRCRSAAERFGLRQVRNGQRERGEECEQSRTIVEYVIEN